MIKLLLMANNRHARLPNHDNEMDVMKMQQFIVIVVESDRVGKGCIPVFVESRSLSLF